MSGSVRSRTVKITHADGYRLRTALKIRSHRCGKYAELVLVRRLYPYYSIGTEQIRTYIQCRTTAVGRNIGCIGLNRLMNGIDESLRGKYRHLQSLSRIRHSLRIQVRPEHNDTPVLRRICLQSLKTGLCILKHARTLIDHHIRIGGHLAFVPRSVLIVGNVSLICLYVTKPKVRPINILLLHLFSPPFFSLILV